MLQSVIARLFIVTAALAGALSGQVIPTITNVVNSASADKGLAPGVMADVIGTNLGTDRSTIRVGGRIPVVLAADSTRWRIVIPLGLAPGDSNVEIGASALFPIKLKQFAPALFGNNGIVSAQGYPNGYVSGAGYPLSAASPARLGDVLVINATGLGPVDDPNNPENQTLEQPVVTIGGQPVLVSFSYFVIDPDYCAGAACIPGMYQVTVGLPNSGPVGNQEIKLSIGGETSQTLTVPINNLPVVKGIVNGASFAPKAPLVPGELASVFGSTFGVKDDPGGGESLPTVSNGVSVEFSELYKAPLVALVASGGQINIQVPTELPEAGPVNVKVRTPEGVSADFTVQMAAMAPGVFFFPSTDSARPHVAAALIGNTAWRVMPDDLAQEYKMPNCHAEGTAALTFCGEPASRGTGDTYVQIYATGLGKAAPDGDPSKGVLGTGQLAPADSNPLYRTVYQPSVTVGGVPAEVTFSGIAPGFAGLYQINIRIPATAPIGDYVPLVVQMNDQKDDTTTLAIKP